MYNELNLDTLTVVFRQDARLTVDGDALVGVVSALQGAGRDGGRVASSSHCGAPLAPEYTKQPAPEEATWHNHWNLQSGKVYNGKIYLQKYAFIAFFERTIEPQFSLAVVAVLGQRAVQHHTCHGAVPHLGCNK